MTAVSNEIPLLTLPSVLFPGTFLPLQVTEESHREMIRACAKEGNSVGVLLMPDESAGVCSSLPFTIGCEASITLMAYENDVDGDGDEPIDVILYGERRIRVCDFLQQDPYLTGHVEIFDDYDGAHAGRRSVQVSSIFQQYLSLIREYYGTDMVDFSLPSDPTMASYVLASILYLPMSVKQSWLESPSTAYRLEQELTYLHEECDKHATLLSISQRLNHRYTMPDPQLYLSLTSNN